VKIKYFLYDDSYTSANKVELGVSKNLTELYANLNLPRDLIVKGSVDWLDIDTDWLVIITNGCLIKSPSHHKLCTELLTDDMFVMGHIMQAGEYYGFHRQWIAVNMNILKQIGVKYSSLPSDGLVEVFEAIRSPEDVHDNFTPTYLLPGDKTVKALAFHLGWNLISEGLKAGYKIYNLPTDLRETKTYLYPGTDGFRQAIKSVERSMAQDRAAVFPYNTDGLISVNNTYEQVVSVAGGINPYKAALDANAKKLILLDYSLGAVLWHTQLNRWRPKSYTQFVEDQKLHYLYQPGNNGKEVADEIWSRFLESGIQVEVIYLDILENKKLLELLSNGPTLLNISNIFCTLSSYMWNGELGAKASWQDFIGQLPNDVTIIGTDYKMNFINEVSIKNLK